MDMQMSPDRFYLVTCSKDQTAKVRKSEMKDASRLLLMCMP